MENPVEISRDILRVMDALAEKGYIAVWIAKDLVKSLRVIVKEKYPDARIEKLSGTETHYIFVSIK